jgi:hypothetical protein
MEAQEIIRCRGHPLVSGRHPTTFEVTKETHLTPQGDCIIGIGADKGSADLSAEFRALLANDDAILISRLECGGIAAEIHSKGSSQIQLNHPTDIVWRKSTFTCRRTIGIHSDHVAASLPRDLIGNLSKGDEMIVTLTVTRPD